MKKRTGWMVLTVLMIGIMVISCEKQSGQAPAGGGQDVQRPDPAPAAQETPAPEAAEATTTAAKKSVHDFALNDIDGQPVELDKYKGQVLLLVNVASECGYTKQYSGMVELHDKYKDRQFAVLGFPANNFGAQEPKTNAEIKLFCSTDYNVQFPMFSKISVKGDDIHPLYAYLTDEETNAPYGGDIKWNFHKFLVDQDGNVIGRYESKVEPMSDELTAAIETALN